MTAAIIGCIAFWAVLIAAGCAAAWVVTRPDTGRHVRTAVQVPAPRRPVNGRYLGTQPRRTPRPGPFTEVDMPVCDEPDEHDYPHYYTDEIECEDCKREAEADEDDLAPIARPWTADQVVYNQTCQLAVLAAAQNPARRDQPVVPAYMSAPAGGAE